MDVARRKLLDAVTQLTVQCVVSTEPSVSPSLLPMKVHNPVSFHGSTISFKLDLVKAFHQIPFEQNDILNTSVITPFVLFKFVCMPLGLRNATQTFQRLINQVLRGLHFCYSYIDNVLVTSADTEKHEEHLQTGFQRLSEDIIINPDK